MVLDEIQSSLLHRWDLVLNVPLLSCLLRDITQYWDKHFSLALYTSTAYRNRFVLSLRTLCSFHSSSWLRTLASGEVWFMRQMPVFSWRVWLHSKPSGAPVAKTIKSHTCAGLLALQETQTWAWGSRWCAVFCFLWSCTQSSECLWAYDWCLMLLYLQWYDVKSSHAPSNPPRPFFFLFG